MKQFLKFSLIGWSLLTAPLAQAWPYGDRDVLLIFRESGFNNVEFDLGDISQFLNKPNGYSAPVTGWDASLVTGTFGSDLTGVSVVLAATTGSADPNRAAWLTAGSPTAVPYSLTPSVWQGDLYSVINAIGTKPVLNLTPPAGTNSYSIDPSGTLRVSAYDYVVSPNGNSIPQFGGHVPFTVEKVIPGSLVLWQIQPSTANPKPPATFIGTFTIGAGGNLTFTAGPPSPGVLGITRVGGVSTVTFSTAAGGNYWLAYTNVLGGAVATWPIVSGPVVGSGNNQSLNHTSSNTSGFYRVVRTP